MMRARAVFTLIVALLLLSPTLSLLRRGEQHLAHAQVAPVTPEARPGLLARFDSAGKQDTRLSRLIALRVPQGAAPTPLLDPGPFTVTWEGQLNLRLRDRMTFAAEGRGALRLEINDQLVLDAEGDDLGIKTTEQIRLNKGPNKLVARYTAPAEGDAVIRLHTVKEDGTRDPVLPGMFTHEPDDALTQPNTIRRGRELIAQHRCIQCHTAGDLREQPGAMPELAMDAPALTGVGDRLHEVWMARWIDNPQHARDDATMPRVFVNDDHASNGAGDQLDPRAADVAAFLATLTTDRPPRPLDDATDDSIAVGGKLFTSLGCIGCHTLEPSAHDTPIPDRISLTHVKAKYQPAALRDFLMRPERHYTWTRMPNFGFTRDEATQVTHFLLSRAEDSDKAAQSAAPGGTPQGDPDRGKTLLQTSGCLTCHGAPVPSEFATRPLTELLQSDLRHGCLSQDAPDRGDAPQFPLGEADRSAIRTVMTDAWHTLTRDDAAEFAERQIHLLNCNACHVRDDQPDRWNQLKAEFAGIEQALGPAAAKMDDDVIGDQSRPDLTWVGEKLKPQWMSQFIYGQIDYKPRHWLVARMPAFASRAKLLAEGMALQHGFSPAEQTDPPRDDALAEIGRHLSGREGFSCITCHGVADTPPIGAFEAQTINFMYTAERMTHDFYLRWVRDPLRYQPGTRMPAYTDPDGRTALRDILNGEGRAQFEAIWQYLLSARDIQPPE